MARAEIEIPMPLDYELRQASSGQAEALIILLHGYSETGERILRKLEASLPKNSVLLAPNGLFPLPERKEDRYRVGYSWYFYNFLTDEYLIDMKPALCGLRGLVTELGLTNLPTSIVGFSQGGYLAPFLAQALPNARRVVGIAARFLEDEIPGEIRFEAHSVHGADDEIVGVAESQASHQKLLSRGVKGSFHSIPGVGHRIAPEVAAKVGQLLS